METTDSVTRRFAAACGLLGQYAARNAFVQQRSGTTTMGGATSGTSDNNAAQQLTIFYGGMVVVVDGCAPDKAAELIRLAAAAAGPNKPTPTPTPTLVNDNAPIARNESLRRFLSKRKERATAAAAAAPVPRESAAYPYQPAVSLFARSKRGEEPAAKKGKLLLDVVSREEAASWLALGSLGSMHAR